MENRLQRIKQFTIFVCVCLFLVLPFKHSFAQNFSFAYTGPDTIFVDDMTCTGILDWDSGNTPTAVSLLTGGTVVSFTLESVTDGFAEGDAIPAGRTLTILYRAVDNMAHTEFFGFDIVFHDSTDPSFDSTPADATYSCLGDVPAVPTLTASDACPPGGSAVSVTFDGESTPPTSCSGGSFTRTWTATDAAGNSIVHVQTITINGDNTPPTITGTPTSATEDCSVADYNTWITAQRAAFMATDGGCGIASLTDNAPATFDQNCGSVTVTFTAIDNCGLSDNVVVTYTVTDDTNPVITPPATTNVTIQCNGVPDAPLTQIAAWAENNFTVSDDCGTVTWSNDFTALTGGCGGSTGTATVVYTASDGCGNSDNVSIDFDVVDTNPPNITQGALDTSVECDGTGNSADLAAWLANRAGSMASDVCSPTADLVLGIMVTSDLTTDDPQTALDNAFVGGCTPGIGLGPDTLAKITIEFTYTDLCDNTSTTDADFVIIDSSDPMITTPASNMTIACTNTTDINNALTNWINNAGGATGNDGCSATTFRADPDLATALADLATAQAAACGNTGSVSVDFYISDECGNENPMPTTASFTVEDTTAPTITNAAQDATVDCDGAGNVAEMNAWLANQAGATATDACGAVSWFYFPTGGVYNPATDADNDPTNNMGYNSVSLTGACAATGSVVVDFFAMDECGNIIAFPTTATFTIQDITAPTIDVAASNMMVVCDGSGNTADLANWLSNFAGAMSSDACGNTSWFYFAEGTYDPSTDNDPTDNAGYNSVSLDDACGASGDVTVDFFTMDECGNITTVPTTATFTVEDTTDPILNTSASDMMVECDGAGNTADLNSWLANQAGAVASDVCGNVSWFYFESGGTYNVATDVDGDPTNNAGYNDISLSADCSASGSVVVDFFFMDDCGNIADFPTTATFTINDSDVPSFDNPAQNLNVDCDGTADPGGAYAAWLANFANATGSDNCGDVSFFYFPTNTYDLAADVDGDPTNEAAYNMSALTPLCGSTGIDTIDVFIMDACGNINPVPTSAIFRVIDIESPVIMPTSNDVTEECDGINDQAALNAWIDNFGNAVAADGCGAVTWINFDYTTSDGNSGNGISFADYANYPVVTANICDLEVEVTFRVQDECMNTSTTESSFIITDNTDPVLAGIPFSESRECDDVPPPAMPTATDNCDANVTITFNEDRIDGNCPDTYTLERTWTATDDCGNSVQATQTISVFDTTNPDLIGIPPNMTVECDNIPDVPQIGVNIFANDNCDSNVDISFDQTNSQTSNGTCSDHQYTITRTWTAEDDCGRRTVRTQVIQVSDTTKPNFTVPADVTVECDQVNDITITGDVNDAVDNCDPNPVATFIDVVTGGSCANEYTIARSWSVEDECGNDSIQVQMITVIDNSSPTIADEADDENYSCSSDMDADAAFAQWLADFANASATDNCSPGTAFKWYALVPGSYNINDTLTFAAAAATTLAPAVCPSPTPGIYRTSTVDFVVTDECGNAALTTATFNVVDNTPPTFTDCPDDVTLSSDPGECDADFILPVPTIIDECANTSATVNETNMQAISSTSPGDVEVPVDPIVLNFGPLPTQPTVGIDPIMLTIDLNNVDGEEPTEYFIIQGEDGSNLGITSPTTDGMMPPNLLQCGNSSTTITLTADQLNAWASDGTVSITLTPNIPAGLPGRFAINDICPPPGGTGSSVTGTLNYGTNTPPSLSYEYSVNGGTRTMVNPHSTVITENLAVGTNMIQLYATDCVGNESTCSYTVTVEDNEDPTVVCPTGFSVNSPSCTDVDVDLPRPTGITDNCGFSDDYNMTTSIEDIEFDEHPNLDAFVANDVNLSFTGTMPPAIGNATLTVYVKGDIDNPANEFFDIIGEDGSILGRTAPGAACGDFVTTTFTIPVATLLAWSADGVINITAEGNKTVGISAGADGDWNNDDQGMNPCVAPGTFNGTEVTVNDSGNSQIYMEMSYQAAVVSYAVTGSTTIGNTAFPSDGSDPTVSLSPGNNAITYTVVDVNGNTGTCTYNVTVGSPSITVPSLVQTTFSSCPGDMITLEETSGYAGGPFTNWIWFLDNDPAGFGGGDIQIAITNTPTVSFPAASGSNNYYVFITDQGCSSPASNIINIDAGEQIEKPVIFASPNPVCEGETVQIFLDNNQAAYTSYQWSGPNAYSSNSPFPPVITDVASFNEGDYFLTVTNASGCTAADTFYLSVLDAPDQPNIASNSPVCDGGDLILTSSDVCDTYLWIGPDGSSAQTLSNPLLQTTTSSTTIPSGNTAYDAGMWMVICVSADGCESEPSNAINVAINNPISISPDNNGPICIGEDIELSAGTIPNATYSWSHPNGYTSASQNPTINNATFADAGTYTVVVTSLDGCSSMSSTTVTVNTAPTITALSNTGAACVTGVDDILLVPTLFPPDDGSYTYAWTGPSGFSSVDSIPTLPNGTAIDNGSYTLVVTNATGCVSNSVTTVVNVTDTPETPVITASSSTVCEGDILELFSTGYVGTNVIYNWTTPEGTQQTTIPSLNITGATNSDDGDYSVFVVVDGCDSNESGLLNVTVNPIPSPPAANSNSPVCAGDTLQLFTELIVGAVYEWTGPAGFSASVHNPVVYNTSDINAGIYTVRIIIDGCPSLSTSLNVEINPSPAVPTVENNGPICIDDVNATIVLSILPATAVPGANYTWYDAQTQEVVAGPMQALTATIVDFSNFTDGSYDFYAIASLDGCSSIASIPTTVEINTIPDNVAFAGTDRNICDDSGFVTLAADMPTAGTGIWTQISGPATVITNPSLANTTVTGLTNGDTYTFLWTLSNGACGDYDSDEVTISVNTNAQVADAGANVSVCNTNSAILSAVPATTGATGTWSQSTAQQGLGVIITDPLDPGTSVSGLVPGNTYTFTWTLSNVGCGDFSAAVAVVTVEENNSVAFAGADITECGDGTVTLNAEPANVTNGTWTTNNTSVTIESPNSPSTIVSGLETGSYTFTWMIDDGACGSSEDDVTVNYSVAPTAVDDIVSIDFGSSTSFTVTDNDIIPGGSSIVTILSDPSNGTLMDLGNGRFTYTPNPGFVSTDVFIYELCSTTCPDECVEATVTIEIINVNCDIPTIITPNNDGINDEFVIPCLGTDNFPDNEVSIFNQWGDEIFRSKPYQNNWRGTYNGEDVPVGTYYYVVKLGSGNEPMSGFLVIER